MSAQDPVTRYGRLRYGRLRSDAFRAWWRRVAHDVTTRDIERMIYYQGWDDGYTRGLKDADGQHELTTDQVIRK